MCSSPHWQVGQSWFREKLSPANREQRLSRWADFAKNCLPRIGSKVLPRFREKYHALGRQKMGSNMPPWYIQFRNIHDHDISGLHCIYNMSRSCYDILTISPSVPVWSEFTGWAIIEELSIRRRLRTFLISCGQKTSVKHCYVDLSLWYELCLAIICIDMDVIFGLSTAIQQF